MSVGNDDFAAFTLRIMRAYGKRIADGDIEMLTALVNLQAEVETLTTECVRQLVSEDGGYSWADVAKRLGMARGNAHRKYAAKHDAVTA